MSGSREDPRWLRGLASLCLRAYPASFRTEHGAAYRETVAHRWRCERERAGQVVAGWRTLRVLVVDTISAAPPAHCEARGQRRRDSRDSWARTGWLDVVRQDLAYALRGIRRSPGFSAVVVVTLALGVGANAAMFSVLDGIFGAPSGVEHPGSLRRLYRSSDGGSGWRQGITYPSYVAVRDGTQESGGVAAWIPSDERMLTRDERELPIQVAWASEDFFRVLGVRPALGRFFGPEESRIYVPADVAVASHDFWTRALSGDPDAVGRTITVDDSLAYTVVGVAAEAFSGLDIGSTDLFLPLNAYSATLGRMPWHAGILIPLHLVARVGVSEGEELLAERATAAYRRNSQTSPPLDPSFDTTAVLRAGPLSEARGPGSRDAGVPISTRAAGVSAVVLLIACANIATLLLVRASNRRREIAVRLALGLSRPRLFAQLLIEGLPLALLAGLTAWALGTWGGGVLRRLILPGVPWAESTLEYHTLVAVMIGAVGTAFLAGVAPGLQALRVVPDSVLKAGSAAVRSRRPWARTALLATQVALSLVLLVGAGLFTRSLGKLDSLELGYDVDRLVLASVADEPFDQDPAAANAAVGAVASRVAGLDGVGGVARSDRLPMDGGLRAVYRSPDEESPAISGEGSAAAVTPEFFTASGIRIVDGRTFTAGDEDVAVVNETMASILWPGEPALGRCLHIFGLGCTEVIGVSSNARSEDVLEGPTPQYFLPLYEADDARVIIVRASGDWRPIASALRAELESYFDPRSVTVQPMRDYLAPQLRPWRLGAQLFTAFGLLALVITLVGVYSVMTYAVSQRKHELGVRVAIGARAGQILRLVVSDGLRVVALGVALGIMAAFALGGLVASLLYGVTPRDPVAMAAAAAGLLSAGALASLVPGWRAARADPVEALSAE